MKMPTIIKRKKLQAATAARRSRGGLSVMDYEEMAEPNMKLSRALLIVLLLHVVAVAGIIAFNTIKTRETNIESNPEPIAPVTANAEPASHAPVTLAAPNETRQVATKMEKKAPPVITEPAKKAVSLKVSDPPKPAPKSSTIADSGKTYTVVKGDNPVTIARHFHVDYAALLELNEISDPRKLQIGTKLHIPEREESTKHKSE
jgi:LysM repeat protein